MKKDISKVFSKLRDFNFIVFNFNFKRGFPIGLKGFVDHVFFHKKKGICFVEVKIGKDRLTPEQEAIKEIIQNLSIATKFIKYRIIKTEQEAKELADYLLGLPQ